ncbi:uncharacterized protein MELLADRAFT_73173 [Melampsora larici-populina 98AG31]|uniref:Secreted protein n=1 Tax=Melampsora larici-populina (strain 98AG31 / pathotype 3-4-7) TaxID=747676 RepID=F4S4J7_MELLP|nr:uncharacterized protein MELLADRAFT_73173 [Melampsora larici-populina 98AG31]EGG00424.1 secreted protein [Melampsora larici-populina 98AG31]
MSWKPSIRIFHLFLVFLLAVGDLSSHIFADANAIDCKYSWSKGRALEDGTIPYLCHTSLNTVYKCTWCGRNDHLIPSTSNCVDYSGKVVAGGGTLTCDIAIAVTSDRPDGRTLICTHTARDKTSNAYYCMTLKVFQQCPQGSCKAE